MFLSKRVVLALHGVYDDSVFGRALRARTSLAMPLSGFEDVIKWLNGAYDFLTFDEYIDGKNGVLLTFDDGYANNLTEALPILEEYSVPAIVFVTCDHLDKEQRHSRMQGGNYPYHIPEEAAVYNHCFDGLTEKQLIELHSSPLIEIGNHTFHHKNLASLDYAEIRSEIAKADEVIKDIVGATTRLFAYPRARLSNKTIQVLHDLGYKYAFLLENGVMKGHNLRLKRLGVYSSNPLYLLLKLSTIYNVYSSIKY